MKTKKQTVYIEGMHCKSCELLIEKYAISQKGVHSANASLKDKSLEIYYKGNDGIDLKKINKEFKTQGYTFSDTKESVKSTPLFSTNNGSLVINREGVSNLFKILITLVIVITLFFVMDRLQLAKYINTENNYSLPAYFLLGLIAGVSSCAALVGGLLLSMTKQWNEIYTGESERERSTPHTMFHLARILSFALFGGILGLIGKTLTFSNTTVTAIFIILISIFMLLISLQMLGVKWAQGLQLSLPKSISKNIVNQKNLSGKLFPLLLGTLTFFLPCGFTLIAQGVALTSGSFITGSLIMFFFALGTLPTLAVISISGVKVNTKKRSSLLFNQIAGVLILFFVIYNINSQFNVLGIPSLSDIKLSKTESIEVEENDKPIKEQTLLITAQGFEYVPTTSTTLKASVPTTLIVNNKGIQGCGVYMVGRGLFPGYIKLKPGENSITFTPKAGTYKLTCSMGMVPPVTIVVK